MYSPTQILDWIEANVQPMRKSRKKTLSAIVSAAIEMRGSGVLSLGRAMRNATTAKHNIKRAWRLFRNKAIEIDSVQRALMTALPAASGPIVLLVDWTDLDPYQILVAALPRDGRAIPLWWKSIYKNSGEGSMIQVEQELFNDIAMIMPTEHEIIIVADRGFGNTRWIGDCENRGWGYVQRLACSIIVDDQDYLGNLKELGIRPGSRAKDWGIMSITDVNPLPTRLVTTYAEQAKEPWYLVTNRKDIAPKIVRLYQRRMWIEEMFRDLKNRRWG